MIKPVLNYPMRLLTTLQIGGSAKIFVEVKSQNELFESIKYANLHHLKFLVIGGGSNLLVSDQGFDGMVIKNSITGIKSDKNLIIVKSGTSLQQLVDFTIKKGLGGIHKLTGIPGTVGGAIFGDVGAYGHSIRDYLLAVYALDPITLTTVKFSKKRCQFGYRDSIFKKNGYIILEIILANLPKQDPQIIKQDSQEVLNARAVKYPPQTKCPGSFFKNVIPDRLDQSTLKKVSQYITPFGKIPAGSLIEAVGGKGDRSGQITIAKNHGNTFINLGGGTAQDFYILAKKYAQIIHKTYGIKLEPEVQLINLPPL